MHFVALFNTPTSVWCSVLQVYVILRWWRQYRGHLIPAHQQWHHSLTNMLRVVLKIPSLTTAVKSRRWFHRQRVERGQRWLWTHLLLVPWTLSLMIAVWPLWTLTLPRMTGGSIILYEIMYYYKFSHFPLVPCPPPVMAAPNPWTMIWSTSTKVGTVCLCVCVCVLTLVPKQLVMVNTSICNLSMPSVSSRYVHVGVLCVLAYMYCVQCTLLASVPTGCLLFVI